MMPPLSLPPPRRYMLAMMGMFSVYCGLIYNDYFSIPLNLYDSNYVYVNRSDKDPAVMLSAYGDSSAVYPFGVDPAWHIADNELLFFNSMKMKMAVTMGIIQMTFGIVLRGVNAIFFNSYLDFFCEFMPMIIFDVAFFGYMVILIFLKWTINWDDRMARGSCSYSSLGEAGGHGLCNLGNEPNSCYTYEGKECTTSTLVADLCPLNYGGTGDGCQPPNLITTLINIALAPGSVDEPMYATQASVQTAILLVAFMTVPWLLVIKPCYLKHTHKTLVLTDTHKEKNPLLQGQIDESGHSDSDAHAHTASHAAAGGGGHGGHGDGEFNFGEIMIHQAIETIEFVLGMVSNTASYLRLWALSLAHSELAHVFWDKALLGMIDSGNPVLIYGGYAVFAAVTFAVLLCMDLLECFLHALRLHWVEFQNKFYKADGYRFQPFDFKSVLSRAILE